MSREPAGQLAMESLGARPVVYADMALGVGTGAAMLLPLLDMVLNVCRGTHTFTDLGIPAYTPLGGK